MKNSLVQRWLLAALLSLPLWCAAQMVMPVGVLYHPSYWNAVLALAPSGAWKFCDGAGSTTFADSSGSGFTLTATGNIVAAVPSIVPNDPACSAVNFTAAGRVAAANNTALDMGVGLQPFTLMWDETYPRFASGVQGIIGKYLSTDTTGYWVFHNGDISLTLRTSAGISHQYHYATAIVAGRHHLVITWDGVTTDDPILYMDGIALVWTSKSTAGTLTSLTTTATFIIGGRSDGLNLGAEVQDAAVWIGTQLSAAQIAYLYTVHQNSVPGGGLPSDTTPRVIYDQDCNDLDNQQGEAAMIAAHLSGQINLIGISQTCSNASVAPAYAAQFGWYGLNSNVIPIGDYKGGDGPTTANPESAIKTQFRPSDTGANYISTTTLYSNLLNSAPAASVWVVTGGNLNALATYLNASGANVTAFNAAVKGLVIEGCQWKNSSSTASPVGNFLSTGIGEFNCGGFSVAAAQYLVNVLGVTVPIYFQGEEQVGVIGNTPALGSFITSTLPSAWTVANPFWYGWNSVGVGVHAQWGALTANTFLGLLQFGTANHPFQTFNAMATPTIDVGGSTHGQNAFNAGSGLFYVTSKVGTLTQTQWNTMMTGEVGWRIPQAGPGFTP